MKQYFKEIKNYITKHYKTLIVKVVLIIFFIIADLLTKAYFANLQHDVEVIPNILSFTFVKNTGAAFGIFPNKSAWLLVFSVIFLIIFTLYDLSNKERNVWSELGFAFVFAGAIGNMVDRIFLGYVRDFIALDFIKFPVFNMADVCITIGCILFVIYLLIYLFATKKTQNKAKNSHQQSTMQTRNENDKTIANDTNNNISNKDEV